MAKSPKRKRIRKKRRQKESPKRRWAAWVLLALAVPVIIGLIWTAVPTKRDRMPSGPTFQKEGTLQFIDENGAVLATIDIEIASDDLERQRGLMWRRTMEPDQGMLFIMERTEPQSFWMLNTYLALDIIFVDDEQRVVNIVPNAKPQSLDPVRSTGPAKFVVEVPGGFCAENDIEKGDKIAFERMN